MENTVHVGYDVLNLLVFQSLQDELNVYCLGIIGTLLPTTFQGAPRSCKFT